MRVCEASRPATACRNDLDRTVPVNAPTAPKTRYFDLPPVRTDSQPAFVDLVGVRRWLEELKDLPAASANGMLYTQLALFTNFQIGTDTRYSVLEALRPALFQIQAEHTESFRGKPLPLSPQRREVLSEVTSLWDALSRGYQRCLEQWTGRDPGMPDAIAGACARALDAVARKMREQHFAYVQIPSPDYKLLHRLYLFAERHGIARRKVKDPLATVGDPITCLRVYARALLLDAAMPREHRFDRLVIIENWVERWSAKVTIHQEPPEEPEAAPLFINLARGLGASREPELGSHVRYVDVSALDQSIAKRIHMLRHGKKPDELELGSQLTQREAEHLLVAVHRQWCDGPPRRVHERNPMDQLAHASPGLIAAHFYVAKQPFAQPFNPPMPVESGEERVRLATSYLKEHGIRAEQWIIRDESLTGLGLVRPLGESDDSRLIHGQLITVRRRGGGGVWIGTIQWLQEAIEGDLLIGARLVPGIPVAVAARRIGEEPFFPALMLDPIPAMNAPTSLLLPAGTYAPQRVIEIFRRGVDRIQLTGVLESGGDYERVAFMPILGSSA